MLLIHILCSIAFVYILVSAAEYLAHRYVMHRNTLAKFFNIQYLYQSFDEHARGHHKRYYRVFNDEPDPEGRHFNLTVDLKTTVMVIVPLAVLIWFFDPLTCCLLVPAAFVHNILFNIMHNEMHVPTGNYLSRTRLFRYIQRSHFLHHKHPNKNFNVVAPLFDVLLGTCATATLNELQEMKRLGLN